MRFGKIFATLLILLNLVSCTSTKISSNIKSSHVLTGLMYSSLINDSKDTEWREKIDGLSQYGKIHFISSVVQIIRPKFNVITPYKEVSPGLLDLNQWNPEFFNHLDEILTLCKNKNIILQISLFNEPTARNDKMLPAYNGDNIQGFKGDFPNCLRKKPSGAWEIVASNLIIKMVPFINRGGAVLFVLEGSNSGEFERWAWDVAKANGLSPSVYVITNSNLPGAIKSPHVKSVASVKNGAKPGWYGSSDGWQGDSPSNLNQCLSICESKNAAAFETWANGIICGGYSKPKEQRTRPTLAQLSMGQFAQFVLTMGKY